jgi:hypothetical protein
VDPTSMTLSGFGSLQWEAEEGLICARCCGDKGNGSVQTEQRLCIAARTLGVISCNRGNSAIGRCLSRWVVGRSQDRQGESHGHCSPDPYSPPGCLEISWLTIHSQISLERPFRRLHSRDPYSHRCSELTERCRHSGKVCCR